MSTPGRRKALRALGRAKRRNRKRYERGAKIAIIGGKKVKMNTFLKKNRWKAEKLEKEKKEIKSSTGVRS